MMLPRQEETGGAPSAAHAGKQENPSLIPVPAVKVILHDGAFPEMALGLGENLSPSLF